MNKATKPSPQGSDWTHLLTDPDLVTHLSTLLRTYREVAPEDREAALLQAMRQIKERAVQSRQTVGGEHSPSEGTATAVLPVPAPVSHTPPFEPDLFTPTVSDRRRFARIKCYVAVEIQVEGIKEPVWGNLTSVSRAGCLVETPSAVPSDKALEIGLWVASGKIWVKGVVINGVATGISSAHGVRVRFSETELSEKEHLREFLKFVESATRKSQSGNAYVAKLKR